MIHNYVDVLAELAPTYIKVVHWQARRTSQPLNSERAKATAHQPFLILNNLTQNTLQKNGIFPQ